MLRTDVQWATLVVKPDDTSGVDSCHLHAHDSGVAAEIEERWDTLGKRLRWVLDEAKKTGRFSFTEAQDWSVAAGLNRTHVSTTIRRNGSMAGERVARLARVAGVNLAWLSSGEGEPDAPAIGDDFADPHPERAAAVNFARKRGFVTEVAVASARAFSGHEYATWSRVRWGELLLELTVDELRASRNDTTAFKVARHLRTSNANKAQQIAAGSAVRHRVEPKPKKRAAPKRHTG